jgi:hypothetical protein
MTEQELQAAMVAARQYANLSGYGFWISDAVLRAVSEVVLRAAERERQRAEAQAARERKK